MKEVLLALCLLSGCAATQPKTPQGKTLFSQRTQTQGGVLTVEASSLGEDKTRYRFQLEEKAIGAAELDANDGDFSSLKLLQRFSSPIGGFRELLVFQLLGEPTACLGRGELRVVGIEPEGSAKLLRVDICSPAPPRLTRVGDTLTIRTPPWKNPQFEPSAPAVEGANYEIKNRKVIELPRKNY